MNKLCIECRYAWPNSDGVLMCGRPQDSDDAPANAPRLCVSERFGTPPFSAGACGIDARYFEFKA